MCEVIRPFLEQLYDLLLELSGISARERDRTKCLAIRLQRKGENVSVLNAADLATSDCEACGILGSSLSPGQVEIPEDLLRHPSMRNKADRFFKIWFRIADPGHAKTAIIDKNVAYRLKQLTLIARFHHSTATLEQCAQRLR